ncbi:MAG: helix-turn-helix domain-containing protein [Hydrogeniiclostridium mannosilyticum]
MLDTATIKAAVTGEKWATEQVIEHYTPTIEKNGH